MTFRQTVFTDGEDPAPTAMSSPILINIAYDDIFEGVEYFQARIVETSDRFRVRIGSQDTVNVTITENDSESFINLLVYKSRGVASVTLYQEQLIACSGTEWGIEPNSHLML